MGTAASIVLDGGQVFGYLERIWWVALRIGAILAKRGAIDLETCLAQLEAADVEVKRELEGARGEVRVMTVHGAKGLEAPIVILPDTTMKAKAQGPSLMPAVTPEGEGEAWLMAPSSAKDDCPASADARAAYDRAIELAGNTAETAHLIRRRGQLAAPQNTEQKATS